METSPRRLPDDFERIAALVGLIGLLGCLLWLILPFLGAIVWAVLLTVSLWPAYVALARVLGERRRLAAALISLTLVMALLAPMMLLGISLADNVRDVAAIARDLVRAGQIPGAPSWLAEIPWVGPPVAEFWNATAADSSALLDRIRPWIDDAARWALAQGASLAMAALEFLLAIVLVGFFCANGEEAASLARRTASRIGGRDTGGLLDTAVVTVRSVATGVIGTALAQAALSAIGFWLAGVPGVSLLGMACLVTALAQVGTPLVWIPATIWMYFEGETGRVIFLIVWNLGVNVSDNFIKPLLIGSAGGTVPLTVVFLGVLGGMLAWGFLGMFLGAVLLAVTYQLFLAWVDAPQRAQG